MTTPAALSRPQAELLDRLARDHRDDPRRLGDVDLDPGEHAVELDLADDPAEAVAGGELLAAGRRAQPLDLAGRDDAAVGGVALDDEWPCRSQRRSVSRLIPSARAASSAESVCLGIA